MAMTVRGICIPVYALIPFALMILQGFWNWFRKNVLSRNHETIPENTRVIHVTSEQQFKELVHKSKTTKRSVVVDFSATWCGPCRYIGPIFHELSVKYPCTIFLKVDVDELKVVAERCNVSAMPTFQFYRNGMKCDEMRGADKKGLETRIQKHYVEVELAEDEKLLVEETDAIGKKLAADGIRQRKSQVVTVTSETQWEHLIQQNKESNKPLVVDFWATWCKPCIEIAPFFEELSGQFPAAVFARVDVDELESVTDEFDVSSLPSFKLFIDGKVVDELNGAIKSALKSMVAKHTAK
ncbi:unnamed protein product [Peronospora belbahrii]|uniref:Thioredoxin domain-containing protein n=1 Tax=Peronospora belbahrii TaxID=622444 RepID=A0ABN8CSE4_9STRA|nr:unnamed protein product [Peronospora belbahrii]